MKGDSEEIDDDDVVIVESTEMIDNSKNNVAKTDDTIILDDDAPSTPIEVDQQTHENTKETIIDVEKEAIFAKLLRNNSLMDRIVTRCMNMENNAGVERVINKTLLPLYKDLSNEARQSDTLTATLKKVLRNLKYDPQFKFMHIKTLCEELKKGRKKKKVPFHTISTELPRRSTRKKKKVVFHTTSAEPPRKSPRKKKKVPFRTISGESPRRSPRKNKKTKLNDGFTIKPDRKPIESNNDKTEIIELEESDNETVINENSDNDEIEIVEDTNKSEQSNKENCRIENETVMHTDTNTIVNNNQPKIDTPNDLLMPQKSIPFDKMKKDAKIIEHLIKEYQKKVVELEEAEVTDDEDLSPYILCDKYKAVIVSLYKKLCKLTGNGDGNLIKQRVVRLHVVDGHPPGPVKRLEQFLNSTIENTGTVPLPDFNDVVRCVTQSNIADQLGWNKRQIMKESIALFTHCGHALRKERQKREYKDLMSLVKDENFDENDPANQDPELLRRLEENKLISKAKEDDIIDKFVALESLPKASRNFNSRLNNRNKTPPPPPPDDSDTDLPDIEITRPKGIIVPTLYVNRNEGPSSSNNTVNNVSKAACNTPSAIETANPKEIIFPNLYVNRNETESSTKAMCNEPMALDTTRPKEVVFPALYVTIKSGHASKNNITNSAKAGFNVPNAIETNRPKDIIFPSLYINRNEIASLIKNSVANSGKAGCSNPSVIATTTDNAKANSCTSPYRLQKIGTSNRYLVCMVSNDEEVMKEPTDNDENRVQNGEDSNTNDTATEIKKEPMDNQDLQDTTVDNDILDKNTIENNESRIQNGDDSNTDDLETEIKEEPMDTQNLRDITVDDDLMSKNTIDIVENMIQNGDDSNEDDIATEIKKEPMDTQNFEDTTVDNDIMDKNTIDIVENSIQNGDNSNKNDIATEIKKEPLDTQKLQDRTVDTAIMDKNDSVSNTEVSNTVPAIKKEPIDIQYLLDRLGDNYISSVFDIEDPFVIVEISDSSDDEDL